MAAALDQARPARTVMRVFRLKHATADDQVVNSLGRTVTIPGVATILRGLLTGQSGPVGAQVVPDRATVEKLKGSGLRAQGRESDPDPLPGNLDAPLSIMADPRVNAVVIQDLADRMPYYERVIADLDQEVHLVEIHAAIVDIDTDFRRDLGIAWQGGGERWDVGSGEISPQDGLAGGLGMSTIYNRGARFFLSRIQALERDGEARMLGRPSVLTADNQEATLENITTYYIPLTGEREVDLFKVETGTVLRVTPHIIENPARPPAIRLSVTVQDDQGAVDAERISPDATLPIKQTKINTQAVIEAGQSLLIGGYYHEERRQGETGVPGLMRVPAAGNLFKTSGRGTRRLERMVLITPRVVRLGEVNTPPDFLDEPSFSRSPTQADYESREPTVPPAGGCRRR
jgi:type III secretion protein C